MNRNLIDTKTDTLTNMPVEPSVKKSIEESIQESVEKPFNIYRQMIESMGGVTSFSKGVSMLPLIRQGIGYVSVVAIDEPQVNDIILFELMLRGEKKNILHRLIEIRPDGTYVCRGDNCIGCEYIRREDIIGRADRIFWTKEAYSLMPRLLDADRDRQNGGWVISVEAPGCLRYVKFWNSIWPLRRIYYKCRGSIRSRLSKIGWLKKIYKTLKQIHK